jgi:hypothetical protein
MAPTLETFLTILDNFYGSIKTLSRYIEQWDGASKLPLREAGIKMEGSPLNVGDTFAASEWLDTISCGRPYAKFIVNSTGYGVVDFQVVIEYGQIYLESMLIVRKQRHRFTYSPEYAPSLGVFIADVAKRHGRYFRIRSIKNVGDINIDIETRFPSQLKIWHIGDIEPYDYLPSTVQVFVEDF